MQSQNRGKLSWADIEGCNNVGYSDYQFNDSHYSNYNAQNNNIVGQIKNDRKNNDVDAKHKNNDVDAKHRNNDKKRRNKDVSVDAKRQKQRNCYTCKPRGKVLKHIINGSGSGNVIFHYDLHKRPIILVTTKTHYESFYDIPQNEVMELFGMIKSFCDFWGIKDYGISYNNGTWQNHPHFHIKIKANEKIINRLRRDHFALISLNTHYQPPVANI